MKRNHLIILAALLAISALMVAGCKEKRTMISWILENPDRYYAKDVTLAGHVTQAHSMNLYIAEAGAYEVDDGSGKIWVVTKAGVPEEGKEVGIKGRVDGGVKLFGEKFGTVIRELDRRTR